METTDNISLPPKNNPSTFSYALKWALLLALLQIIFSLVIYLTGQILNAAVGWLQYPIILAVSIYATINFRNKESGGVLSFGKAFVVSFQIMVFAGIIAAIYSVFIFMQFIYPGMLDDTLKMSQQKMVDKGMTDDQIEMGMKYTKMFMKPGIMFVFAIFGTGFFSAILSLIVAAICKKENNILLPPQ